MTINFDHVTEQIQVTDAATNASLTVQPKGTGSFNIAAGSSGVNLSNGGTVTAITRTAAGTGYTSKPSIAITAPTTAGGVQAVLSVDTMTANTSATVTSGGTGYTNGDVLTAVGGTPTATTLTFTVTAVSGGVITAVSTNNAQYSTLPSNPISVTGGTGTGATFTPSWIVTNLSVTTAGSGYVEQPTVTFSGGGGSGAAAFARVGGDVAVKGLGTAIDFYTSSGRQFQVGELFSGSVAVANYVQISGRGSGAGPTIAPQGSDTNIGLFLLSKGTGSINFTTNGGAQNQFIVAHTASAVNYVQVTGAATGTPIAISAQGSDSNIRMNLFSKGTESVDILTSGGSVRQARFTNTASTANWVQMTGAATGFAPSYSVAGSDADIPLVLQPKGTGALQAQQTDSTTTGGNVRGANAVDWQTVRSAASQVASNQGSVIVGGRTNTSSGQDSFIGAGYGNTSSSAQSVVVGGAGNIGSGQFTFIGGGTDNRTNGQSYGAVVAGFSNTAAGYYNFVGGGSVNSATSSSAVTTQSATMNATTAVTLSGSNANIKVGQLVTGTYLGFPVYVTAVSGTSLTISTVATGSGTATLSFYTPHGVVVGGGNNQATGSYSFIGGGGDAGTAANRNVASGDWSFVGGGVKNVASGLGSAVVGGGIFTAGSYFANTASGTSSFVGGGTNNTASGSYSSVIGGLTSNATGYGSLVYGGDSSNATGSFSTVLSGMRGLTRGIIANAVFSSASPISTTQGSSQTALLVIGKQTTDATASVLTSDGNAASTNNQVILPNNSAYFFTGEIVAGVTGGGNTKGWTIEGVIKRGANAASTALVGTPMVVSSYADVGAATWTISVTADTTNGGLAVTFTGQAATTIRVVAQIRTTEMTF